MTDRNYNPHLDQKAQELVHDEMDTLGMILNMLPEHLRGVASFILFDEDGAIHTTHLARILSEEDRNNAVIGMLDVCTKLLIKDNME